jgi:hypothetical protein
MGQTTRRLFAGPLLALAVGAGALLGPAAAHAAGVSGTPRAQAVKAKPAPKVTYKVGTVRSTDGKVNIRTAPSTSAPVTRSVATDPAPLPGRPLEIALSERAAVEELARRGPVPDRDRSRAVPD